MGYAQTRRRGNWGLTPAVRRRQMRMLGRERLPGVPPSGLHGRSRLQRRR